MAGSVMCGMCKERPAEVMYMTLADADTVEVCGECLPIFIMGLAIALGIMEDPTAEPEPVKPSRRSRKAVPEVEASDPTGDEIDSAQEHAETVS